MVLNWGTIGVSVFFAISGFIITRLLIIEHEKAGRIDLKAFYVRRACRILPALWVFLGISLLLSEQVRSAHPIRVFLFLTDYLDPGCWWLAHTWSLSVEEQFYLLWPWALWALGPFRSLRFVCVVLLAAPGFRIAMYYVAPSLRHGIESQFHSVVDTLMIGCLIAFLVWYRPQCWFLRLLGRWEMAVSSLLFAMLLSPTLFNLFGGAYLFTIGISLRAVSLGCILYWCVGHASSIVGRILESRPFVHIGLISYSLYLWQQPLFDAQAKGIVFGRSWVAVLYVLLLAEVSYRCVELPILTLRRRVTAARSALNEPA